MGMDEIRMGDIEHANPVALQADNDRLRAELVDLSERYETALAFIARTVAAAQEQHQVWIDRRS